MTRPVGDSIISGTTYPCSSGTTSWISGTINNLYRFRLFLLFYLVRTPSSRYNYSRTELDPTGSQLEEHTMSGIVERMPVIFGRGGRTKGADEVLYEGSVRCPMPVEQSDGTMPMPDVYWAERLTVNKGQALREFYVSICKEVLTAQQVSAKQDVDGGKHAVTSDEVNAIVAANTQEAATHLADIAGWAQGVYDAENVSTGEPATDETVKVVKANLKTRKAKCRAYYLKGLKNAVVPDDDEE